MRLKQQADELVLDLDDETPRDAAQACVDTQTPEAAARSIAEKAVPADLTAAEAVSAEAVAVEAVASKAIAAETIAARGAAEIREEADETATLMVAAAKAAADKAAKTAKQTARAAADAAARNAAEVAQETAATAEAVVAAALTAADELEVASRNNAGKSGTDLVEELAVRAAATAEAAVATAATAATHAAGRARHDTEAAAEIAAQAADDLLQEASVTADAMVTAAASAATAAAEHAADRARDEAYARSQAELLNAVVDSIKDGVEVVDQNGLSLMHNRAAEALGIWHDPVSGAGEPPTGLFRPDGVTAFPLEDTPLMRALAGESSDGVEILARSSAHPNGVLLTVSGRPLSVETGHPGAVAVYRDVTNERAHRTELESFAAVAAHDLSAPLAIVSGYLDVISELVIPQLSGDTAPTVIDILRRACGGAARMSQLIDDLLSYAASDAELATEDFDLRALVNEVIASRTEHLGTTATASTFSVGALPWVCGDRARIAQVLNNLIGNALKYKQPDQEAHIEITAELTPTDPGAESQVDVKISDRGIGIPAGHHAAIFTSLHRAHPSAAYSGTGLGLAICARIIELHGGHIRATDNPGGGTRVHFTLPRSSRDRAT